MELKKYKLEEIANIVNGATPSTSCEENYDGDIVWITPKDLSDQRSKYIDRGSRNITQKGCDSCSVQMIPAYNILMSSRAPIGLLAINTIECCTNQGFKNIIVDKSICDIDYLYYYLKYHIKEIEAIGSGTTFKEVSKTSLQQFEIALPALEVQKHIASILSNIDCKIELNRAINQNLEAMAKQLYDYWFVQFDFPNEEGKPYKSSGGEMVWNEKLKKMIPKEWTNANIYQLANISKESINPQAQPNDLFKHYSLPEYDKTRTYAEEYGIYIQSAKFVVTKDCILVSKLNPWTSRVICGNKESNQICSTEFVVWNPISMRTKGFLFMLAKSEKFIEYCTQGATGTSHSHRRINPELMMKYEFPYNSEIAMNFSIFIENIIEQIHTNITQLKALTKQRNELLPLLMNGQVSVNSDLSDD